MRCHVLVFLCLAFTVFAQADEKKSGVGPSVISLPSGPGSIEGLGESFEPQLNTGSSTYSISLETTPGIAGHQPSVSLSYNSGAGNDVLGIGWSLGVQSIQRQTDKGQPKYNGEDTFIFQGEELIPLVDGSFALKNTSSFLRFYREGDTWLAKGPNGHQYRFGLYPSKNEIFRGSRLGIDLETKTSEYNPNFDQTYRWYLSEWVDTNGNKIEYYYSKNSDSNGRLYPSEIRYNQHGDKYQSVVFHYEDRPDVVSDYRSGFLVQTAQRLSKVQMFGFGQLAREYRLGYELSGDDFVKPEPINKIHLGFSQLAKVTQYGRHAINHLPPLRLEYTPLLNIENSVNSMAGTPASIQFFNSNTEFMDVNADGLPDIYSTQNGEHIYALNQGDSTFGQYQIMQNAPAIPLSSENLVFTDLDGDAKVDLLHKVSESRWAFYRNRGNGEYAAPLIDSQAPAFSLGASDTRFSDINFDKKIDILRTNQNGTWSYCLSQQGADVDHAPFGNFPGVEDQDENGNGKLDNIQWDCNGSAIPKGLPADGLFQNPNYRHADMNGDRLLDFVWLRNIGGKAVVSYYPSKGFSNFDRTVAMTGSVELGGMNLQDLKLTDINGDGLADLVKIQPSLVTVWFNQGDSEWSEPQEYNGSRYNPVNTQIRFADLNGNGTQDLVWIEMGVAQSEAIKFLDFSPIKANQLSVIDNGIGKRTIINYKSTTDYRLASEKEGNPWTLKSPVTMQVVSKVTVEPGLDLDTKPGNDQYISEYVYRDAWYDVYQKEFRGFGFVKSISIGDESAPTSVTRTFFHTGAPDGIDNDGDGKLDERGEDNETEELPLKGQVLAQETTTELAGAYTTLGDGAFAAAKDTFQRVQSKLTIQRIHNSDGGTQNVPTVNNNQEVSFAYALETLTDIIELGKGSPKRLKATTLKDAYGNTLEAKNYGVIDEEGDEQFTFSEYINDIDRWMIGFPLTKTVTDKDLNRLTQTKSYYDGGDFVGLPFGQVDKGLMTRSEAWVAGNEFIPLARSAYDQWGNIVSMMDGLGNLREIEYDSQYNIFPISETIYVNQKPMTLTVDYDTTLGVVTSQTDLNGHRSTYQYDAFGRSVAAIMPGADSSYPSQQYSYILADPHRGLTYEYDNNGYLSLGSSNAKLSSTHIQTREQYGRSGTLENWQYVDGMGRKLGSVAEDNDGYIFAGGQLFNAKGVVRYSFEDIPSTSIDYPALNLLSQAYSQSHYDASGRGIWSQSLPDKKGQRAVTRMEYQPLYTTVIDANANRQATTLDGLERTIEAHEYNQGELFTTRYQHNAVGKLTQVTDAQNNIKTMAYDGLSRKTAMNDPDNGLTKYIFDNNSNLIEITDNKNQVIQLQYDEINRLLSEDFKGKTGIEVSYEYDDVTADYPGADNLVGKLAAVHDQSGSVFFSYDQRGNSLWQIKRLQGKDYRFSTTYDAMDRIVQQAWPDGESIVYEYDNRGLVKSIPGVIDSFNYRITGQIDQTHFANGVNTQYQYDGRHRLTELKSEVENSLFQHLTYDYDNLNNIIKIDDERSVNGLKSASQMFIYDDLYRLTQAKGAYGAINYGYNAIGNLTQKHSPSAGQAGHIDDPLINLKNLTYGGDAGAFNRIGKGSKPGPHAVTSTESGLVYDYDDNGNMIKHGQGDQYEWDYKNRLTRVVKPDGSEIQFTYDRSDQRVSKTQIKAGVTTETLYIGSGYEIRKDQTYKYIYAGGKRVARVRSIDSAAQTQTFALKAGWNFIAPTLEPSNRDISQLIQPIANQLIDLYAFDSRQNRFIRYESGLSSELTELEPLRGYMVHMKTDATWIIEGRPVTQSTALDAGWNLTGFPVNGSTSVANTLASMDLPYDSIWKYQPDEQWQSYFSQTSLPALNSLSQIVTGQAYWLNVPASTVLTTAQPLKGRTVYYHADHLGSANMITNAQGQVIDTTEYYPFGRQRYSENIDGTATFYKFTGQELDKETGLSYHSARYMDPVLGRFISVDPLLVETPEKCGIQECNLYGYSQSNPVNFIDRNGEKKRPTFSEAFALNEGSVAEFYPEAGVVNYYENDQFVSTRKVYAGGNVGKAKYAINNLKYQYVSNTGPAPVHTYMLTPEPGFHGHYALRMIPKNWKALKGRGGFLFHSGWKFANRSSSKGCLIPDDKGLGRKEAVRYLKSIKPYTILHIKKGDSTPRTGDRYKGFIGDYYRAAASGKTTTGLRGMSAIESMSELSSIRQAEWDQKLNAGAAENSATLNNISQPKVQDWKNNSAKPWK